MGYETACSTMHGGASNEKGGGAMGMMPVDEQTAELLVRIRKKCQDRGWFGADEWMDPGFSSPPPFRTTFPPVATAEQLEHVEQELGFPLPRLLRDLYLHLANGEVGFGYGILPVELLLQTYRLIRERTCFDGAWHWPKLLIPLCYWGDTLYSYLDSERAHAWWGASLYNG